MGTEVRQVLIDGYPIDVAKMETHSFTSEVTQHPVESGGKLSDHIIDAPDEITLECLVSDTPISEIANHPTRQLALIEIEGQDSSSVPLPSDDVYARLKTLRKEHRAVTIETSLDKFENMVLTRLTIPRNNETTGGLTFEVSFQAVTIVEVERIVRVAEPRGRGKTDFGLLTDKLVVGKQILWRKGLPPGSSPSTSPPGVIVGQEIVYVVSASSLPSNTPDGTLGPRLSKGTYVHEDKKTPLTSKELTDFIKDLNRDSSLITRRGIARAEELQQRTQVRLDKGDQIYEEDTKSNLGKYVDPAGFGM